MPDDPTLRKMLLQSDKRIRAMREHAEARYPATRAAGFREESRKSQARGASSWIKGADAPCP